MRLAAPAAAAALPPNRCKPGPCKPGPAPRLALSPRHPCLLTCCRRPSPALPAALPGHTASWGKAYPELLTRCYNTEAGGEGDKLGPINPARNET